MSRVIIAVHLDDIERYGAQDAIVLQQIRHHQHYTGDGWYTDTSDALARICGLSGDQVRRTVRRLIDAGAIEKRKFRAKFGDHTLSYRASEGSGESAESQGTANPPDDGCGESAGSTSSLDTEEEENPPVVPPRGDGEGGDQPFGSSRRADPADELFPRGDTGSGFIRRRERQRRSTKTDPGTVAAFERWWENYPRGGNIGSKSKALAAFVKARSLGVSVADLDAQLGFYVLARSLMVQRWGQPPKLLNAATFLNSRRTDWDHEWTLDDCRGLWPPPDGQSWDAPVLRSRAELLAEARERESRIA